MNISNKFLSVELDGGRLVVTNRRTRRRLDLAWPAVRLAMRGKVIEPADPLTPPMRIRNGLTQSFRVGNLTFDVRLALGAGAWLRKNVRITAAPKLPTPDYVELDAQIIPADALALSGYQPRGAGADQQAEEEGRSAARCRGYPVIGRTVFAGVEHPAGMALLTHRRGAESYALRHFPVWEDGALQDVGAVLGFSGCASDEFADYLRVIRLPQLRQPFVTFCTFWSDPYLGDMEYAVSARAYHAFITAFERLGLRPDAFMLDAGWSERQSIGAAKSAVGGDAGLRKIARHARQAGASLALWTSHNGPMAYHPDFLRRHGYAVGGGQAFAYSGDNYGVMLDDKFARAVSDRLVDLARKLKVSQYKIDWDNEHATNPKFKRRYPTPEHVCQATLNMFFQIGRRLRAAQPGLLIRNGWLPSPWWLSEVNHVWLTHSGDSEHASWPARSQREAAQTHRDWMYFNILRRDRTPLPLDCFDNHEFPHALRNPFVNTPADWLNACWLAFCRGSTYVALTLQPEGLEDWQAAALRDVMRFCRAHAASLYVADGRMILGDPGRGEVYGFLQPGVTESWCLLRNSAPVPQTLRLDAPALCRHPVRSVLQFYPHFQQGAARSDWTFLPHEIKLVIFDARATKLPFDQPCMVTRGRRGYDFRFPAARTISGAVGPVIDPVQRIPGLRLVRHEAHRTKGGLTLQWQLQTPYRMRAAEVAVRVAGAPAARVTARHSRYYGMNASFAAPVTALTAGAPGYGEKQNGTPLNPSRYPRYFSVPVPAGGEFTLQVQVDGITAKTEVSAWLYGYEAPSRAAVTRRAFAPRFARALPPMHPYGFGAALSLPVRS